MIEESLLVPVFGCGQNLFAGMHGSLANGVHYKTVLRRIDSGMEEEFLGCKPGISSN
jgi:hypothetical protein